MIQWFPRAKGGCTTKASDRYTAIERIVRSAGTVSFAELKQHFPDISDMTLRRDLERLDRENRLVRVHGGARSIMNSACVEADYTRRSSLNTEAKRTIAGKAAELLRSCSTVFLDSGTTVTELCRHLTGEKLLLYTNGVSCIMELQRQPGSSLHLLGGCFDSDALAVFGPDALDNIQRLHFDTAVLGTIGYDFYYGFTCEKPEDAQLKSAVIRRSDRCVVLMDTSKLGRAFTYTFARPEEVDAVVTEGGLDAETLHHFTAAGIRVL